jgi:DNA replicative helicase MCM subunit Mcm2 (Cdc46/Mcm family)
MGLDVYLSLRKKLTDKEKMCINLGSEKPDSQELCYWRKEWEVVKTFGIVLDIEIENVTEYIITKEQLKEIYKLSKDKQIKEALKIINWETHEVVFYSWW